DPISELPLAQPGREPGRDHCFLDGEFATGRVPGLREFSVVCLALLDITVGIIRHPSYSSEILDSAAQRELCHRGRSPGLRGTTRSIPRASHQLSSTRWSGCGAVHSLRTRSTSWPPGSRGSATPTRWRQAATS